MITSFVVDSKQNTLYAGLYDHTVVVWKNPTTTRQKVQVLGGVPASIVSLAQDATTLYAAYFNGVIRAFQKSVSGTLIDSN